MLGACPILSRSKEESGVLEVPGLLTRVNQIALHFGFHFGFKCPSLNSRCLKSEGREPVKKEKRTKKPATRILFPVPAFSNNIPKKFYLPGHQSSIFVQKTQVEAATRSQNQRRLFRKCRVLA